MKLLLRTATVIATGLSLASSSSRASADTIGSNRLLIDLSPGADVQPRWASPLATLRDGRILFWSQIFPDYGRELYVTDGTAAGTVFLADANPGWHYGAPFFDEVAVAGDFAFFAVNSEFSADVPWITDGTPAGTYALDLGGEDADLCFVEAAALPRSGRFLFTRHTPDTGCEPAIYDPRTRTWETFDFFPGSESSHVHWLASGSPLGFPVSVLVSNTRQELWLLDTGEAAPRKLAAGELSTRFQGWFRGAKGWVLAGPGEEGDFARYLWRTDGTAAGTVRLPNRSGVDVSTVVGAIGPRVLFTARDHGKGQVWSTNGSPASLRRLTRFQNTNALVGPLASRSALAPGLFAFVADDGVHGAELWRTDGTAGGTVLAEDLCPGACSTSLEGFDVVGERIVFQAVTEGRGREPWALAPERRAPTPLAEGCAGPCSFYFDWRGTGDSRIYYSFSDLSQPPQDHKDLWVSDGTAAGTRILEGWESSFFSVLTIDGFDVLGAERRSDGVDGLIRTDGTSAGTALFDLPVAFEARSTDPRLLAESAGWSYFSVPTPTGYTLYATDGTEQGTRILPANLSARAERATPFHNGVLVASSDDSGSRLVFIHGPDGPVEDLAPCALDKFLVRGPRLWFVCHGEVWVSDGSPSSTLSTGWALDYALGLEAWGTTGVAFVARNSESRDQVYATASDPQQIAPIGAPFESEVEAWAVSDGRAYVVSRTPDGPPALHLFQGAAWTTSALPEDQQFRFVSLFAHPRGVGLAFGSGQFWSSDGSSAGLLRHTNWTDEPGDDRAPVVSRVASGFLFSFRAPVSIVDVLTGSRQSFDFSDDFFSVPGSENGPAAVANGQAYFRFDYGPNDARLLRTKNVGLGLEELVRSEGIGSFLVTESGRVLFSGWERETGAELRVWEP